MTNGASTKRLPGKWPAALVINVPPAVTMAFLAAKPTPVAKRYPSRTKYTLAVYQTIHAKRIFKVVLERLEGSHTLN
ncbi:hypothetical protein BDR05DRAFT_133404 [Suillus weaverae]|nr:hypothetical protein BDR05DRAFT_133404 [Suillus weaverae]